VLTAGSCAWDWNAQVWRFQDTTVLHMDHTGEPKAMLQVRYNVKTDGVKNCGIVLLEQKFEKNSAWDVFIESIVQESSFATDLL
jgi:hypothetical protein